jgi:MFS family permease
MIQPVSDPASPASAAGPGSLPDRQNGRKAGAASLAALSWLNFLAALMQAGFGAFLVAYLTQQDWTRTSIGFALGAAMVANMASQVPGGMLVDWIESKRRAAAGAVLAIMTASMLIAWAPLPGPVYLAVALHGTANSVLVPAIAALTLALSRQEKLGERFGHNVRFTAVGAALAASIMGTIGAGLSYRAIYCLAALCALPGLAAIFCIRVADLNTAHLRASHAAALHPRHRSQRQRTLSEVFRDPALLVFAALGVVFQLGNTGMLPLAAGAITRGFHGLPDPMLSDLSPLLPHLAVRIPVLVVSAWIVAPQLLAAWLSPRLGQQAQLRNRRHMLLLAASMEALRAVLFAVTSNPAMMIVFQLLDGIATAILAIMVPLVVADITHRGGRFNLAIGIIGLASGIGGALSMGFGGMLADRIGETGTFLAFGGIGVAACLLVVLFMPDTRQMPHPAPAAAQRHAHPGAHRHAGDRDKAWEKPP